MDKLTEQEQKELRLTNLILGVPTANAKVYLLCRTSEGLKSTPINVEIAEDGTVDFLELIKHRHDGQKDVYKLYSARIIIAVTKFCRMEINLPCQHVRMQRGSHYTFDFPEFPIILKQDTIYGAS